MSGLSRTPGKRVWVYPHRGFESRLLRHLKTLLEPCFSGVCFMAHGHFQRPLLPNFGIQAGKTPLWQRSLLPFSYQR